MGKEACGGGQAGASGGGKQGRVDRRIRNAVVPKSDF